MEILVVILASALAVFLILSIVMVYKIIKLINSLKLLADKAEHIAEAAESVSSSFRQAIDGFTVARAFGKILKIFTSKSNESKKDNKEG